MDLYVYKTPYGNVADFRGYLDGLDHTFEDPRPLQETDPRWEKIDNLLHPATRLTIARQLELVGYAQCRWKELMVFPVVWDDDYVSIEAGAPA